MSMMLPDLCSWSIFNIPRFNHKTDAEDVHFTSVSSHSDSDSDTDENMKNEIDADTHEDQNESNVASPKSESSADDASSSTTEILEMIMVRDVKAGAEVSISITLNISYSK